ncbi:MAG: hypothetical protein RMJ17_01945 [Candidatus Aenigmarchaeota archaeon]|nr:hypothetical protein [Candidatus Aenigmarchaeota archaeon]MDW8149337.1 hypothetical protein [Candidatus Aenigmarchaeota archaeon]
MIYAKLYSIGNKSLDNFVYAARTNLIVTSYGEWSAADPFLLSKEEAIKFFTGFDFTPFT